MLFLKKNITFFLLYYAVYSCSPVVCEKITFFAVEHPVIQYINPNFISYANMTCRRYSRLDPVYYFNIQFGFVQPVGNNFTYHYYFYELLTNVYKPSFVELHMKFCNLINKDPIFGVPFKRALQKFYPDITCPMAAGDWKLQNLTLSTASMPNFPFTKGRIYLNITFNPTGERSAGGYVDFQIKSMNVKTRRK